MARSRTTAGFALFFHNYSTFLGIPGLYLEDLYVRPTARGRGIGKALLSRLAQLALERGVGLHVDGCLGGFILPWGQELGYDIPDFHFRLPGVTSMSADTHKYGYGPKGTSVCMFRNKNLRQHQYFMDPDWQGGMYLSPGMSGSRSGGLIAATWAVMYAHGREGYLEKADAIFKAAYAMQEMVKEIPDDFKR